MQAKDFKEKELLCINTDKVYDWIVNEATFDLTLEDVLVEDVECDNIASVTCEVDPQPAVVLSREDRIFTINHKEIELQLVTIQKTFEVTVIVTTTEGTTITLDPISFTRCEQVVLCAPEGTTVTVDYTDVDCFVCVFDCDDTGVTPSDASLDLGVTVRLCQSIQSTFPVTLEIVADFCVPRDREILPTCPPVPTRPQQCPAIFPKDDRDHDYGHDC